MNLTEKFADQILKIMKPFKDKADYWDVRFGEANGTQIIYRSKILEEISFPKSLGGSVRMLVKGGWGFVTFCTPDELGKAAEQSLRFARLVGKEKSELVPIAPEKEYVKAEGKDNDFLKADPEEKIELLNHYRDLLWRKKMALVQSQISYSDAARKKLFVSSEGACIEQEFPRIMCQLSVVARKESIVQRYITHLTYLSLADLKNKDGEVEDALKTVNSLVDAPVAKGGEFPIVMDGKLAGTFVHEAFGHLSEADNVEKDEQLKKIMKLGKKFGNEKITIYDDPSIGQWGNYKYDDEGVRGQRSMLLEKGILTGRLHNRQTAGILKEKPNGHGRASGVEDRPMVRMGTTVIEPGEYDPKSLIKGIKKGYCCVSWLAGMTDYENFTFSAAYGYEIHNGRLGRMVRDLKISGNLFETLKVVEGVGSDSIEEPGVCGKLGQSVPVGTIAPSVRLGKVLVMGA